MKRGSIEIKVDDTTRGRWIAAARERGYTLSEFIAASVEFQLETPGAPGKKAKPEKGAKPSQPATHDRGNLGSFRGPDFK